jgi:uncharacterized protein (TIGR04255 family)
MPRGAYANAPITEAVLDLQTEAALEPGELQKLKGRFTREYPNSEELVDWNFGFGVDPGGKTTTQANEIARWYKLTSNDQADIVLLKPNNLTTSRLSPYRGWDQLFEAARKNYNTWRRIVGYKKILRIASRYINRIDIPSNDLEEKGARFYFNVVPSFPGDRPALHFFLQSVLDVKEIAAKANFFFGPIPSPLLDHTSFLLDIDLYRDQGIPTREEEMWDMVGQFRHIKNRIFEDSLTDRARDLFDAA